MKKRTVETASLTLSGIIEEEIYRAAYQQISNIQRSLSQPFLKEGQSNHDTFWAVIQWGTDVMSKVTDSQSDTLTLDTPQGKRKVRFDEIQHLHSMDALSEGISEVLIAKCHYPKDDTCLAYLTAIHYAITENGIVLSCSIPEDQTVCAALVKNSMEEAWDIQQRNFINWARAYHLTGRTICNFDAWDNPAG
jgi:hypothetical protein